MKTGIVTTDTYLNHNTGQGHPENADRVSVVIENLKKIKNKNFVWKKPNKFDAKYLKITHNSNYVSEVEKSFPKKGLFFLDGDTIVSPGSKEASSDAVGSIITAIDGVQNREFQNAFCAVRPPGHHAEKNKAMGFWIYNNVAVGANYLLVKYKLDKKVLAFHNAGAISQKDLFKKCEEWNFKNLKLYAGDVKKTSKKYARDSRGSRIALLYLDVDNYEGTLEILKNLYNKIL